MTTGAAWHQEYAVGFPPGEVSACRIGESHSLPIRRKPDFSALLEQMLCFIFAHTGVLCNEELFAASHVYLL